VKTKAEFDTRSAEPVLTYVGPGIVGGIPAADLSANQLARLAWASQGESRPASPDDVKPGDIAALRDALIGTGNYQAASAASED
jgi:hypothetical protein